MQTVPDRSLAGETPALPGMPYAFLTIMQPSDKRAKLKKATISRCRMHLKAYLFFLPGFPLRKDSETAQPSGVLWRHDGKDFTLTSDTMRKAGFGWNELKKFPLVFPKAVDDVEAWRRAVPEILDMLGQAVYDKTEMPDSLWDDELGLDKKDKHHAATLLRDHGELEPLLNAISWIFVLNPGRVTFLLDTIESRAEKIVTVLKNWPGNPGIELVLQLLELERLDGPERLDPLMELLGTRFADQLPIDAQEFVVGWRDAMKKLSTFTASPKRFDVPAKHVSIKTPNGPVADRSDVLREFVENLAAKPTRDRRTALELFDLLIPCDIITRWNNWWREAIPIIKSAENLLERAQQGVLEDNFKRAQKAREFEAKFRSLFRKMPSKGKQVSPFSSEVLDTIANWGTYSWKPYWKQIRALLESVNREDESRFTRIQLFLDVQQSLTDNAYHKDGKFDVRTLFREMASWGLSQPVLSKIVYEDWEEIPGTREKLPQIGRMLRLWSVELKQSEDYDDVILISYLLDEEPLLEKYLHEFAKHKLRNRHIYEPIFKLTIKVSENEKDFATLLDTLDNFESENDISWSDWEHVLELEKILGFSEWKSCLREMLLGGNIRQVMDVCERIAFLVDHKTDIPVPKIDDTIIPAWISRYPQSFQRTLRLLNAVTPRAQILAEKHLSLLLYDTEQIRDEIASLEKILEHKSNPPSRTRIAARIERRIENLSKRLELGKPPEFSETRLARLHGKVHREFSRALFEHLHDTLTPLCEAVVCRELQIGEYPQAWREPLHRKIVSELLLLDAHAWRTGFSSLRRLGVKLLRHLCSAEPWDYRAEEANVAFLEKIAALGVNVTPWTDPAPVERLPGQFGEALFFGIERDPMEILKMGAPFQTCLSPGGCNFFSAMANLVDINKHILYVKNAKGDIRARCLIALGNHGELVAFRAYAHDPKMNFQDIVAGFLQRLSGEMNTVVVDGTTIPTLVSPEWYNDGSIAISEHLSFLKKGSPFCKALKTLPVSQLVPELERRLAPLPLRPFVLRPFLNLPILETRPELVVPLQPMVSPDLDTYGLAKLITFLHRAGATHDARKLLQREMLRKLDKLFFNDQYLWESIAKSLVEMMPMEMLPHVRGLASRPKFHEHDSYKEYQSEILVLIYEKIGRKKKAEKLKS